MGFDSAGKIDCKLLVAIIEKLAEMAYKKITH